jgi:hypothetical protein
MVRVMALIGAVIGVCAATAVAEAAPGAERLDLLGPQARARCDGSGVREGIPGFGFAVINTVDGSVRATVALQGVTPDTTYRVLLIQGIDDCFTTDTTLTTNRQGNGTVRLSEPTVSGTAFVAVCRPAAPVFEGCGGFIEAYITPTYFQPASAAANAPQVARAAGVMPVP